MSTHGTKSGKREYHQKVRELVRALKSRPCTDCGIQYPYYVMEFDHVNGEKEFGMGSVRSRGPEAILREAEKCDVVCSNCHKIREFHRRWGE